MIFFEKIEEDEMVIDCRNGVIKSSNDLISNVLYGSWLYFLRFRCFIRGSLLTGVIEIVFSEALNRLVIILLAINLCAFIIFYLVMPRYPFAYDLPIS